MSLVTELLRVAKKMNDSSDKEVVLKAAKVLRMDREPITVLNLITVAREAAHQIDVTTPVQTDMPERLLKAAQDVEGEWDG